MPPSHGEDVDVGDGSTGERPDVAQPTYFAFDDESIRAIDAHCAKYPPGRQASAVIAALYEVQKQMRRQTGSAWVPRVAMDAVAHRLEMAPIRVYEVGTFYLMFNTNPIGRCHLQLCTTTPCWLRGSDDIEATIPQGHRHQRLARDQCGRDVHAEPGRVPGRLRERPHSRGGRRLLRRPRRPGYRAVAGGAGAGRAAPAGQHVRPPDIGARGRPQHASDGHGVDDARRQGPDLHQPLRHPRLDAGGRPQAR